MKPKLYYLGKPADGFGWGVANTNLVAALSEFCEVIVDDSKRDKFDAPVFVPVGDSSLKPLRRIAKAPRVIGYCFTEWPLTDEARRNARQYDVLFAGSTWNADKLKAAGVKNADVLIQGIDFNRFKAMPPSDRKGFVVFSGGKWEFRKGQDYVVTAMKHFMAIHDDAMLLAAWHNPWPATMKTMDKSWLIDNSQPTDGLPMDRVILVPPMPNEKTPDIYKLAHVGLFPNRCEAGTNLVMSEFMACGRTVIAADAHGHRDVLCDGAFKLTGGSYDPAGWFNCDVSEILAHLEDAYRNRQQLKWRGNLCRANMENLTWRNCAIKIVRAAWPSSALPA
jgi:glycosyltransferase involved in cell wall biosynthesis